jgi:hypothetical protein
MHQGSEVRERENRPPTPSIPALISGLSEVKDRDEMFGKVEKVKCSSSSNIFRASVMEK